MFTPTARLYHTDWFNRGLWANFSVRFDSLNDAFFLFGVFGEASCDLLPIWQLPCRSVNLLVTHAFFFAEMPGSFLLNRKQQSRPEPLTVEKKKKETEVNER